MTIFVRLAICAVILINKKFVIDKAVISQKVRTGARTPLSFFVTIHPHYKWDRPSSKVHSSSIHQGRDNCYMMVFASATTRVLAPFWSDIGVVAVVVVVVVDFLEAMEDSCRIINQKKDIEAIKVALQCSGTILNIMHCTGPQTRKKVLFVEESVICYIFPVPADCLLKRISVYNGFGNVCNG